MADSPRRPTLHLKLTPKSLPTPPGPTPLERPAFSRPPPMLRTAPRPAEPEWKCRPCGKSLFVGAELGDDDAVRCPSCNARLGLARHFREAPPNPKVRARLVGY